MQALVYEETSQSHCDDVFFLELTAAELHDQAKNDDAQFQERINSHKSLTPCVKRKLLKISYT